MTNIVFQAAEEITITGYERECDCSHCGRPLKVGVKLAGFVGAFGSDCLAKSAEKQKVGPYIQKLAGASIRERAIIAGKGAEYASRQYGWQLGGANFRLVLKTPLKSIWGVTHMWLDADTTPPIRSVYAGGKSLKKAIAVAERKLIDANAEGQIGIYHRHTGSTFLGYVIRYAGEAPYFEEVTSQ